MRIFTPHFVRGYCDRVWMVSSMLGGVACFCALMAYLGDFYRLCASMLVIAAFFSGLCIGAEIVKQKFDEYL